LILNPQSSWSSKDEYAKAAKSLVGKFKNNYSKYDLGDNNILSGGPL
jgi:ATP-dependent phosphoenolpyruvate carboxykinase